MEPTNDMDLFVRRKVFGGRPESLHDLLDGQFKSTIFTLRTAVGTEAAPIYTDVCRVDMPVHHEVDIVAVLFPRYMRGESPEFMEICGLKKPQSILSREALTGKNFLPYPP